MCKKSLLLGLLPFFSLALLTAGEDRDFWKSKLGRVQVFYFEDKGYQAVLTFTDFPEQDQPINNLPGKVHHHSTNKI